MIVSVTERGTFKRCRQMWDYSSFNRQGITRLRAPHALSFGSLVHKVHELWLENPEAEPEWVVAVAIDQTQKELIASYRQAVGVDPSQEELDQFLESGSMVLDIFRNYKLHYGASLPEGYTLLHAEQTSIVPIPDTEHDCSAVYSHTEQDGKWICAAGLCDGSSVAQHYLEATFDALMTDAAGRVWILERKTYNTRPKVDALQMNDQFLGYLWALDKLGLGEVGGLLYDGMWKRYRQDDRGKERKLEDLFYRVPLIRSPEEIANFGEQLRDEVLDMADARIYRNARWEGCWDCQFTDLCLAEFRGEDADYVRGKFYTKRDLTPAWESE